MRFNPHVLDCGSAPIAEAWTWVSDDSTKAGNADKLIDACQAVPPTPPPQDLRDHVGDLVRTGHGGGYTEIAGLSQLRTALAQNMTERYGAQISADNVVITAGCNQAYCTVIDALCETGDEVILPAPYYFNHEMWLTIRGVKPVFAKLQSGGTTPEIDNLSRLVTPRTKAIVLVTPNNPTGAIYSPDLLAAAFELAREHNISLIVDETYRDFVEPGTRPHELFAEPDWTDTLVHLYSFSKAYSLTGYRVGAICTGRALREQVLKIQDCTAICASHIGQLAALYALNNLQSWKERECHAMTMRGQAFATALAEADLDYRLMSASAYFAYVRHPFDVPARDVARRLARDHGVVSLPGSFFGPGQERFLRFAFSNVREDQLPDLMHRLTSSQVSPTT